MGAEARTLQDLLSTAQKLLEHLPGPDENWDDHVASVREITRELDTHGVDGLSLIRFGMAQAFTGPVLGSLILALVLEPFGAAPPEAAWAIDVAGWCTALGVSTTARTTEELYELLRHARKLIEGWATFAPIDALTRLVPAPSEELTTWAARVDPTTREAAKQYQWFVERTLDPDLTRWSTSSLKFEYRYSVQGKAPLAPRAFLATVDVDPDQLAHALATRVLQEETRHEQLHRAELNLAIVRQAKMLLTQGRHTEAAALFEFLITRDLGDPALRNNLGFCLVTTNPLDATEHLRAAQRMGFEPKSLLLYNRACCATTEAVKREVLFEANRHWLAELESAPVGAFVWRRVDGELVPTETPDVRVDLARIAVDLALELGEFDRASGWENRLSVLGGG